tara:strand:- start:3587 stop:4312 length:726 start_codon:yes stop_codon:yes gene_type:complete
MNKDLTILIPVRDEEENVKIISREIIDKILCKNYEILFVNDFSQDRTEDVILEIMKNEVSIRYINNQKKGLGGAIQAGIKESEGKFVCIMMSDSSDTVEDLNTYYNTIISDNFDAVFGSRFIKGGRTVNYPLIKYILNRLGNRLAQFLMWSDLNDFTNGFKIYKKEVLDQLNPLVSESFNIFFELPLKIISRNYKYKIIPIEYYNRTVGEAKFKIDELGSKYLFTLLYCFLEKLLLGKKNK